jgi:hypothetical protein
MTEQLEARLARLGARLDREGEVLERRVAVVLDRPDHPVRAPGPLQPNARRPKRALVAVGAFAAILAIVLAVVAARIADDSGHLRRVVPPSEQPLFPDVMDHTGPELFLSPQRVPTGYNLLFASGPDNTISSGGSPAGPAVNQYWVHLDSTGTRPDTGFTLGWGPAERSPNDSLPPGFPELPSKVIDGYRGGATPITVAGRTAYWSPHSSYLAWEQHGQVVVLEALLDKPPDFWPRHLTQADVLAIAERVVRNRDGSYRIAKPPTGYRLAAEVPNIASTGINARKLVYSDGNNTGFSIHLIDNTEFPPGVAFSAPNTQLVNVHGQPAVLRHALNGGDESGCVAIDAFLCSINLGDRTFTYLQWLEPDSTRVTITAVGLTDDQVLGLGRTLTSISASDWKKLKEAGATRGCALIAHCTAPDHPPERSSSGESPSELTSSSAAP